MRTRHLWMGVCVGVAAAALGIGDPARAQQPAPVNPYRGMQEREEVFEFTHKPQVKRKDGKWIISFASKGKCDATVAILGPDGQILRHLASGVLGKNAPWPFQQDSLAQEIEWDGKDDAGNAAPAGCKIRVSLGLKPAFERILLGGTRGLRGPISLACAPDGTLYVADITMLGNITVQAFDRSGAYIRTVVPYPATMPAERLKGLPLWQTDAGPLPIFFRGIRGGIYPFLHGVRNYGHNDHRGGMAVSSDGRLAMVSGGVEILGKQRENRQFLLRVRTDGSVPEPFVGPPLLKETGFRAGFKRRIELAFSPDEKSLFVSSLHLENGEPAHAVYRVGWADAELPEPFVGDAAKPGNDQTHLNDPRGIALDATGNLYVADWGNNRVAVFGPDSAFRKAIAVQTPDQVAVHPKTGVMYVLSWASKERSSTREEARRLRLVKIGPDDKPVAEMLLSGPPGLAETSLALDPTAQPPVLWLSNAAPGERLRKVVDKGASLETAATVKPDPQNPWVQSLGSTQIAGLAVDRQREEVYVRQIELEEPRFRGSIRIDGVTGKVERLNFPVEVVGPDGALYGRTAAPAPESVKGIYGFAGSGQYLRRHDRQGRLLPFPAAEKGIHVPIYGDNATHWMCDFTVTADGTIYILRRSDKGIKGIQEVCRQVDVYAPDGRLRQTGIVTGLTTYANDIEVDRNGCIYLLEHVKRQSEQVPAWAGGLLVALPLFRDQRVLPEGYIPWPPHPQRLLAEEWGALLKFRPAGGKAEPLPRNKFYPPETSEYIWENEFLHKGGVRFEGLEWLYAGASRVVCTHCRCLSARFDQDGWGRSFVPQTHRFAVAVVDQAGNEITRLGGYGNFDSAGPKSAIPTPAIPLWWPNWVAVSDRALYIADEANLRIVKVALEYAAEETVPAP